MADRFFRMSVFKEAAERGSFSAAGEALGISSQMAGRHVAALEKQLGTRLLERTTRKQQLTEAGRIYLYRCKAILAEVDAADSAIHAAASEPRGLLRVTAPVTFGASSVVPVIARFMQTYPEVHVELTLSDRNLDLLEDSFDAAVRIGDLTDSSLIARPLEPYTFRVAAAPAYLRSHGMPDRPADLAEHACLGFNYATRPTVTEWVFQRAGSEHRISITPRFSVNDARAMHAAALAGLGVVMGPTDALAADIAAGRLVQLMPDYTIPSRPMHIVYASRHALPKLSYFVSAVIYELAGGS